jgi:hypothetical protein
MSSRLAVKNDNVGLTVLESVPMMVQGPSKQTNDKLSKQIEASSYRIQNQ